MAFLKSISRGAPARFVVLAFLAYSLSSCTLFGGGAKTPAPEAVFTSAAQTAQARSTEMFAQTPTIDPASMVATIAAPSPTATEQGATEAVLSTPGTPVTSAPTGAGTVAAPPPASGGGNAALYVADVTVPDGTTFSPGEAFDKTWRISNSGTNTWTTAYSLIFIDGDLMGAQTRIPLPGEVAPGEEVEITIPMIAPETAGSYTGFWKMSTADGTLFGFGAAGNEAIWVKITVAAGEALATGAPTGTPLVVSNAQLSVDNASAVGPCPYTFTFTGQIMLSKAATVTYLLEAGNAAGGEVRTPLPMTRNLAQGVHPVLYELTLPESLAGWARLHITAPIDLVSEPVNFTLTCG